MTGEPGELEERGFDAPASAGDPTTLQEVPVGPGVRIWPPPSVLVPLLGDASGHNNFVSTSHVDSS